MKILLSCVNSVVSLIGFDLEAKRPFWYCPTDRLKACGVAYDYEKQALLIATENTVTRMCTSGKLEAVRLPGPHRNLAHSVHVLGQKGIGVADTGNSRVLLFDGDLKAMISFSPLEGWGAAPEDALHLNDFAMTPYGMVASCFHYQPLKSLKLPDYNWQPRGYGLLLSLEKFNTHDVSRIVAAGLACPHSLVWHKERLYCCASATGEFLCFRPNERGTFLEEERLPITNDYFLRGALPLPDGSWILGGSSRRRQDSKGMGVVRLHPDKHIEEMFVAGAGEIYDILSWDAAIMEPLADIIYNLPPVLADEDNTYPPPCVLEK